MVRKMTVQAMTKKSDTEMREQFQPDYDDASTAIIAGNGSRRRGRKE
jgi:hypothetical protein